MPPSLDVYVLTKQRNSSSIQRFLDTYVDQVACHDRTDEELMIAPLDEHGIAFEPTNIEDWDWEPAQTLTHMIARGLDFPRRSFTVYLKSKVNNMDQVILAFTADNLLVLGLSIDDTDEYSHKERRAREQMYQLMAAFDGCIGMICVEQPPPLHESAFLQREGAPRTICFWKSEEYR